MCEVFVFLSALLWVRDSVSESICLKLSGLFFPSVWCKQHFLCKYCETLQVMQWCNILNNVAQMFKILKNMFTLIWIMGFLIVSKVISNNHFYIFRRSWVNNILVTHCPLVARKESTTKQVFLSFDGSSLFLMSNLFLYTDVQCELELKLDWKWFSDSHERALWDGENCTGTYWRSVLLQISVLFSPSVDPHFRIAYQYSSGKTTKLHRLIKFGMNCLISKFAVSTGY